MEKEPRQPVRAPGLGRKKMGCVEMLTYSSVCFAATSPILGEELEYQTFQTLPLRQGEYPEGGREYVKKTF